LLAISKFDRYEWAIEKLAELGVSTIVPTIAQRSEKNLVAAAAKRVERWRRVALSAAEQARRAEPPEITAPMQLGDAMNVAPATRIVLLEPGVEPNSAPALANIVAEIAAAESLALAIGPEGGWTPQEARAFREHGWRGASLGSTILRVETAAIAATAIAISQL